MIPGTGRVALLAVALLVPAGLTGCGSSGPSSAVVTAACQQVGAVLSDGPDPGADPVGYAEAQVLPLRQIHTSDRSLQQTIERLASSYEAFYKADGTSIEAKRALASAEHAIDAVCPKVTQ